MRELRQERQLRKSLAEYELQDMNGEQLSEEQKIALLNTQTEKFQQILRPPLA